VQQSEQKMGERRKISGNNSSSSSVLLVYNFEKMRWQRIGAVARGGLQERLTLLGGSHFPLDSPSLSREQVKFEAEIKRTAR